MQIRNEYTTVSAALCEAALTLHRGVLYLPRVIRFRSTRSTIISFITRTGVGPSLLRPHNLFIYLFIYGVKTIPLFTYSIYIIKIINQSLLFA